jgi:hypothetical protein
VGRNTTSFSNGTVQEYSEVQGEEKARGEARMLIWNIFVHIDIERFYWLTVERL